MPAVLTEKEFSRHLNTTFHVELDGEQELDVELVEVRGYVGMDTGQRTMERFSVFFVGPEDIKLGQHTYRLQHEVMGEFDIFLVPIQPGAKGYRYEAVFNRFLEPEESTSK